jgi:hypothetical protein
MSTDEERAHLLRCIARGGYSPYEDNDGSTANTLYGWAEELAPMRPAPPAKRAPWYRRQWLRFKLRRKMRRLGMLAVLAMGTLVPKMVAAQQAPSDSLYALPSVRAAIGEWSPGWRVWCLTRHADFGTLFVLVSVATPDSAKQCARPEGGSFPLVVDLPECPRGELVPTAAPFMLARCDDSGWVRFPPRTTAAPRTI